MGSNRCRVTLTNRNMRQRSGYGERWLAWPTRNVEDDGARGKVQSLHCLEHGEPWAPRVPVACAHARRHAGMIQRGEERVEHPC